MKSAGEWLETNIWGTRGEGRVCVTMKFYGGDT